MLITGHNVDVIQNEIKDNSIDIIVTSPPYDDLRDYHGYELDLHGLGKEMYRVLKDGGIAAVVIQDSTKNFGKSLSTYRLILDWCDNAGFKLFENVIYKKQGVSGAWWNKRFRVDHEYILIFLKGARPQFFDKENLKVRAKHGGKEMTGGAVRNKDGTQQKSRKIKIADTKCRGSIWDYTTCGDGSKLKHKHPATFPELLPYDLIECFCPENGVVLDPFVGSGTTLVAAKSLNRNYIGIDVSSEYIKIAEERLSTETISRPEEPSNLLEFINE